MSPATFEGAWGNLGFPRVSGDEPPELLFPGESKVFSPRERG